MLTTKVDRYRALAGQTALLDALREADCRVNLSWGSNTIIQVAAGFRIVRLASHGTLGSSNCLAGWPKAGTLPPMTVQVYSLSVEAVILDGQWPCLLLQRSPHNENFVGNWEWPGGKVEAGKDFTRAMLCETRVETSLGIAITGLRGATQFEMTTTHVDVLCTQCRLISGKLKLSDEQEDFFWTPLSELPRPDLPDQTKPFMLNYAARRTKSVLAEFQPCGLIQ